MRYNYVLAGMTFMISLPVISLLFWKSLRNANEPKPDSRISLEPFSPIHYTQNPWNQPASGASSQPSLPPTYGHAPAQAWGHV
jgi:hypothetical protein